MPNDTIDLSVDFCGIRLRNPFMLASSPVSNSAEMIARGFEAGWAGVVYKTLGSDRLKMIHPSPRMRSVRNGSGRMVAVQNCEQITDRPLKDNLADLLYLKKRYPDRPQIHSIMGFSTQEWAYLAKISEEHGADMLELNFSCPNMCVEGSGHDVGKDGELLKGLTEAVKEVVSIPVMAKLTPNITDMTEPARFARMGGADAISAINTVSGISGVDLESFVPAPGVFGRGAASGMSGPAVKPIGMRFISNLAQCREVGVPLSGIGGIESWVDALEYILVGASTVQVATGIMHYGYQIVEDMVEGLSDYMAARNFRSVTELVGKALPNLGTTDLFDLKRQGVAQYDLGKCVGCGQCFKVCRDAGGQAIEWDEGRRRPRLDEAKCLSCMLCSFVCPVEGLIGYKAMPRGWDRDETAVMDSSIREELRIPPFIARSKS